MSRAVFTARWKGERGTSSMREVITGSREQLLGYLDRCAAEQFYTATDGLPSGAEDASVCQRGMLHEDAVNRVVAVHNLTVVVTYGGDLGLCRVDVSTDNQSSARDGSGGTTRLVWG